MMAYMLACSLVSSMRGGGGNTGDFYLRPGGVDFYNRPDGTSFYLRP
jgi:hypothetical protein